MIGRGLPALAIRRPLLAVVIMVTVPFGLAALFTLYLTPVAYLALARFAKPRAAEGARRERELRDAESVPDGTQVRPAGLESH